MTTVSGRSNAGPSTAGSTARNDHDIYRLSPSMDAAVLEAIAARLEFRGGDEGFVRLSQAYLSRLPLRQARRILALGCGTGVEVRALRRLTGPDTEIIGLDQSSALIDEARRITAAEGLSANLTYEVGDAHHTRFGDGEFDIVALHTLISHVDDPPQVLKEARRLVPVGGTVAVFDGDYASLTFAYPDHGLARTIEEKLISLIVANPRVMRDMPRLLHEAALDLVGADGALYAEIGGGRFWVGAADSYGALLAGSGLVPEAMIDEWRDFQSRSAADNTFFGSCSYYTYLTRRPD
jgi:SAM-dependent methyltransferase